MFNWDTIRMHVEFRELGCLAHCRGLQRNDDRGSCTSGNCYYIREPGSIKVTDHTLEVQNPTTLGAGWELYEIDVGEM